MQNKKSRTRWENFCLCNIRFPLRRSWTEKQGTVPTPEALTHQIRPRRSKKYLFQKLWSLQGPLSGIASMRRWWWESHCTDFCYSRNTWSFSEMLLLLKAIILTLRQKAKGFLFPQRFFGLLVNPNSLQNPSHPRWSFSSWWSRTAYPCLLPTFSGANHTFNHYDHIDHRLGKTLD